MYMKPVVEAAEGFVSHRQVVSHLDPFDVVRRPVCPHHVPPFSPLSINAFVTES